MLDSARWHRVERRVAAVIAAVWDGRAELVQAVVLLLGWVLVTRAIAQLTRPTVVWDISIGVLLLSICGWKFLGLLFWRGLYSINQDKRDG